MGNTRPYWKVIVSLTFSLIATVLFVGIGWKLLWFFMPFVIGWFIAFIVNPVVCLLEKKLKIVKKFGSAIIIIAVLAAVIGLLYMGVSKLMQELGSLIENFPQIYDEMETGFREIGKSFQGIYQLLPEEVQKGWSTMIFNLDSTMGELIGRISEPTVEAAGNVAKSIPSALVSTIVMIVSAYFFVAQRDEVIIWSKKITPRPIQERMTLVIQNLKFAVGGYFKAQLKIMVVVGAILLVGFGILKVHYAGLLAILIAMVDFLPFFGTGTVLLPWAVYKLLVGNYKMAIILLVLYGVTQLVRQLIQPKLVGDGVGLNPLLTLVLLYIGYKIGSILGMIFAVPIGMIIINMYKAGAFDYILDDVKILVKGIISLREGEK